MKNVIKIFQFIVTVFPHVVELIQSLKKPKRSDTPPPVHEVEFDKVE